MSDNKENNTNSNNNSFFSRFPQSPFHSNYTLPPYSYYPYTINTNLIPCNKCIELQNEMKLMNKNIELLNKQIKLLDLKMSIISNKQNHNQQKSFNRNRNRKRNRNLNLNQNLNLNKDNSEKESPEQVEPKIIVRVNDKKN